MAHEHEIFDSDAHFVINSTTKNITTTSTKLTLMQYDHNSEVYTFELPRYIDGHDMTLCNKVRIHFCNISSNKINRVEKVYPVEDFRLSEDSDDICIFTWKVSRNCTMYSGSLSFCIRFYCISDDSTVDYAWGTDIFSGIKVGISYDYSDAATEEYDDILSQWENDLKNSVFEEVSANYQKKPKSTGIELLSEAWVGDNLLYSQMVAVPYVTANSQVELRPSPAQLQELLVSEISMTVANDEGSVTVFAIGGKPSSDYYMQIIISEVDIV